MKKILLVEDDPNIVSSLTLFMKNEGYLVDSANGQQTALQKIAQEQYDIILLDISLNDGNGFSTCSAIKSQKDIPIIFLTADDDEFSVVSGLELGADDYICKPFRPRELLARINTVLRRKNGKSEFLSCKDVASTTENSRQTYMLLKMMVCIFTVLMTMIIGLNVCNTISNTIDVRRSEFAVLRSVGMTSGDLKKMLLLESVLYGMKSLIFAIPISLIIHYVMYSMISKGMTPFVFYINWGAYGIAVIMVALVVVTAMLFSLRSIEKVEIVKELKTGSM